MGPERFSAFRREHITAGQHELAEAMRVIVFRHAPDIYAYFVDAPDRVFLEPNLFAYFHRQQAPVGLPQILLGYVEQADRPVRTHIRTDRRGRAYVPRIGYFLTSMTEADVELCWDAEASLWSLEHQGNALEFRFEPILLIPGTEIELFRYENPLFRDLFVAQDMGPRERGAPVQPQGRPAGPIEVEIDGLADLHLEPLARAFTLMREYQTDYYEDITACVRSIHLFRSGEQNSFVTLTAHGTAFLNLIHCDEGVPFFLDDLPHQCGHVAFYAMTVHRNEYLQVPATTEVNIYTGDKDDPRTVYEALHGLFTERMMTECMRRCDERGLLTDQAAQELNARLAFILVKYRYDLRNLSHEGVLAPLGAALYENFRDYFAEMQAARPELLSRYDFSNQHYTFSYRRLLQANPWLSSWSGAA